MLQFAQQESLLIQKRIDGVRHARQRGTQLPKLGRGVEHRETRIGLPFFAEVDHAQDRFHRFADQFVGNPEGSTDREHNGRKREPDAAPGSAANIRHRDLAVDGDCRYQPARRILQRRIAHDLRAAARVFGVVGAGFRQKRLAENLGGDLACVFLALLRNCEDEAALAVEHDDAMIGPPRPHRQILRYPFRIEDQNDHAASNAVGALVRHREMDRGRACDAALHQRADGEFTALERTRVIQAIADIERRRDRNGRTAELAVHADHRSFPIGRQAFDDRLEIAGTLRLVFGNRRVAPHRNHQLAGTFDDLR